MINIVLIMSLTMMIENNIIVNEKLQRETKEITTFDSSIKTYNKEEMQNSVDQLLDKYNVEDDQITIIYENLTNGSNYALNENKEWFAASTYKLPLVVLVLDDIAEDKYKITDKVQYTELAIEDGPINNHYKVGEYIPIKTLLHHSIIYSDNAASLILVEHLGGWIKFEERASQLTKTIYSKERDYDNDISPLYASELLKYLYDNRNDYDFLFSLMKKHEEYNSTFFKQSENINIYSKTGWYNEYHHELAIVDEEYPFSIVIFYEGNQSEALFSEILDIFIDCSDGLIK